MATVYNKFGGRTMEKGLALMPEVQDYLDGATFEIAVRAEELLLEHRQEGHAEIEVEHERIDHYVILSDERGQLAALSIEYGREAYGIDEHGRTVDANDPDAVRVVGAMDGLYILHEAAHLRKKRKGKVKFDDE